MGASLLALAKSIYFKQTTDALYTSTFSSWKCFISILTHSPLENLLD